MTRITKETDRRDIWPREILDWHEEVSRTEFASLEGEIIVLVLDAFGTGFPGEILDISLKYCAERMSFGLCVEQLEELAAWLARANKAALALRARNDTDEKTTRIMHNSKRTCGNERRRPTPKNPRTEISHIDIPVDIGETARFSLNETGYGDSRQALAISLGTVCLSFGLYDRDKEQIVGWLIAAKYAVGVVRARKEKFIRVLEKEFRGLHT
jgi:hypothetical protein